MKIGNKSSHCSMKKYLSSYLGEEKCLNGYLVEVNGTCSISVVSMPDNQIRQEYNVQPNSRPAEYCE